MTASSSICNFWLATLWQLHSGGFWGAWQAGPVKCAAAAGTGARQWTPIYARVHDTCDAWCRTRLGGVSLFQTLLVVVHDL
jgi:hypothetical protein